MPEFLKDILVVTGEELVPRFWNTYNALAVKLWRDEKRGFGMERAMRGGNCRQLLVKFDSLPKKIQEEIGDPRKPQHILQEYYKVDSKAVAYYENEFTYPDGQYLLPDTSAQLIVNASVLNAVMALEVARNAERVSKNSSLRGVVKTLFEDTHSFNTILEKKYGVKHTLNTNERTFKQQYIDYMSHGYISLIKDPEGKSKHNALKRDEATDRLLNDLFAGQTHKPTQTEVADLYDGFLGGYVEVINNKTGEVYNPKEFKALKPRAIRHFLTRWDNKIGTFAKRSGDRQKLMQTFVPYESLEQPYYAGSMISIDDRQPPFWYDKGSRMWWYLGIDLASEAITAWAYGKTKEELILNFYRQLVRNYAEWGVNLPDALECESSLNSSFKDTFLQNGRMFQEVQIHPNSARSKRIERYYGNLRYGIEKEQEGWIARPFALSENNQTGPTPTKIIPYGDLVKQCFKNIVTWNNMPCSQDKSRSRFDYFKEMQHPDLKSTNYKGFVKHLGYKTVTSCNAGIMHLQHGEWLLGDKGAIYTGEDLIKLLRQVEGKTIDVYWLDGNNGEVLKAYVYDYDSDRYICEALPKPIAARAPIERRANHLQARELMGRYRNTVTMYMQTRKNAIDSLTVIDNRPKTISDSFSIPGVEKFKTKEQPAEQVATYSDDDFEYKPNSTTQRRSRLVEQFYK